MKGEGRKVKGDWWAVGVENLSACICVHLRLNYSACLGVNSQLVRHSFGPSRLCSCFGLAKADPFAVAFPYSGQRKCSSRNRARRFLASSARLLGVAASF